MEEQKSRLEKQYTNLLENISAKEFVKIEYLKSFAPITEFSTVTQSVVYNFFQNNNGPITKNSFKTAILGTSISSNQDKFLNLLLENLVHDRVIKIDNLDNITKLENFTSSNPDLRETVKQSINKAKQGLSRAITYREKVKEIGDVKQVGDQYEIYDKNNTLITTITMSEEDRKEYIKKMVAQIIKKIVYQSTSSLVDYINVENEFCVINGDLYPIYVFKEITLEEPDVTEKAFNNYFMFLSNNRTIFYDVFMKKYLLRLEDTHIVGMDLTKIFDEKMFKNPDLLKKIADQSNIRPPQSTINGSIKNLKIHIAKKFSQMSKLDFAMEELKHQSTNSETEIANFIKSLNKAQQLLTSIMTNPKESHQTDLLAYFISLENDFSDEKINEILNTKAYYFSNEFIKNYKDDPEKYKNKIILKAKNNFPMLSKYSKIMEYQDYLTSLHLYLTKIVIESIDPSKWSDYFGSKYENDGKLNDTKIGSFGLAYLYISYNVNNVFNVLNNSNTECAGINTPKNSDKLYFLHAFNYIVDVKNVYIVDRVNNIDSNMICEMEAIHTKLLAYFEKYNFLTGVAEFFSIQDAQNLIFEDKIPKKFIEMIPSEYLNNQSLISLCEAKKDENNNFKYSNALSQTQSDFAKKTHSVTEILESIKLDSNRAIKADALRLRTATSAKVKINRNIPFEEQTLINRIMDSIFKKDNQDPIAIEDENMMNIIGCLRALTWIENIDIVFFSKFSNITSMTYREFYEIKIHLTNQTLTVLKDELNIQLNFLNVKRNKPGLLPSDIQTINTKIASINSQIIYIENIIDNSISILNSTLDTEADIENVFETNKGQYDIDNKSVLFYLSEIAKEKGFIKLSEKIKRYCFGLYIKEEKEIFEIEYQKQYSIYLYQTGAQNGQAIIPSIVNQHNEKKSVEIFDREMLPLKNACLNSLSTKLDNVFHDIEDEKHRYLEMADKELSSIIQVENSRTGQTQFESRIDIIRRQGKTRLTNIAESKKTTVKNDIQAIANDSDLKNNDKAAMIFKKIKSFIDAIKLLESSYSFNANELINEYHFEEEIPTINTEHETEINKIYEDLFNNNCTIEALVELLIEIYLNEINTLKEKYDLHGGYYFEQDLGEMGKIIDISKKRTKFISIINQKSDIYRRSIWSMYEILIERNSRISSNTKQDIKQHIILRMAQATKEIERNTNSKIFSQGIAEFGKDSFVPNVDDDISRETFNQINNLEERDGPSISGPKM